MRYRMTKAEHQEKADICAWFGQNMNQQAGGWSIGHQNDGDYVVLTFPDSIVLARGEQKSVTRAWLDELLRTYSPTLNAPPPTRDELMAAGFRKLKAEAVLSDNAKRSFEEIAVLLEQ